MIGLTYRQSRGLWTPVLTFATPGDLAVTYSTQTGLFEKSGPFFTAWFSIITSAFTHTTASGLLLVNGCPASASASLTWEGTVMWGGITKASYTQAFARIVGSAIRFSMSGSGVPVANVMSTDVPTGGSVRLEGHVRFRL